MFEYNNCIRNTKKMISNRGIASIIDKFLISQVKPFQTPTQTILTSLKSLTNIVKTKKQQTKKQLQISSQIKTLITYQQVKQLKQYKQKIKQNQQMLRIIQICRDIDNSIARFQDNISGGIGDQQSRLRDRLVDFKSLYLLVHKLDEEFNSLGKFLQNISNKQGKQRQDSNRLKYVYLSNLKDKFYKTIVKLFYSQKRIRQLQTSLEYFKLPLKTYKNPRQSTNTSEDNVNKSEKISDPQYQRYAFCIIQALFCQYSCYCLQKKIQMIFGQQADENEGDLDSMIPELQNNGFNSTFFNKIWYKVSKSISFIFMDPANQDQQNNAYQIDEPNWLFEYMFDIFKINYRFISENILSLLKDSNQTKEIIQYIQTYFMTYNIKNYFLKFIIMRLQTDIKVLKQQQKAESIDKKRKIDQRNHSAFIMFNFLDQLHILSQKINDSFDFQSNFVELVLVWAQKSSPMDLLSLTFDYEHNWIEQRIFEDFSNINYSSITDLKNVQAYNITVNFTHIFQKLYSKYRKITTQSLLQKIHQFYNQKLLQLVRHIKTSFERIYNHGDVDKYQTLISYKKVQDQFRGYFGGYIHQSPVFQQQINEEYYSVLEKYTVVLALEKLTTVHKQIYKRLSDNNQLFIGQNLSQNQKLSKNKKKWSQIFEQWQQKMLKINKLQPNYQDKKIRNIFFVFLQQIQFSQDGFYFFISIFQPFMIAIFSVQGTYTIKKLLEMEKGTLKQYCKSHQNDLWFLANSEIRSIQRTKIKRNKVN